MFSGPSECRNCDKGASCSSVERGVTIAQLSRLSVEYPRDREMTVLGLGGAQGHRGRDAGDGVVRDEKSRDLFARPGLFLAPHLQPSLP